MDDRAWTEDVGEESFFVAVVSAIQEKTPANSSRWREPVPREILDRNREQRVTALRQAFIEIDTDFGKSDRRVGVRT